jgi:hypothetical protein
MFAAEVVWIGAAWPGGAAGRARRCCHVARPYCLVASSCCHVAGPCCHVAGPCYVVAGPCCHVASPGQRRRGWRNYFYAPMKRTSRVLKRAFFKIATKTFFTIWPWVMWIGSFLCDASILRPLHGCVQSIKICSTDDAKFLCYSYKPMTIL